jgi:hypothetical protein
MNLPSLFQTACDVLKRSLWEVAVVVIHLLVVAVVAQSILKRRFR